jgi:1-acyl-sn-glycerol-3-phosphate acyltransferase
MPVSRSDEFDVQAPDRPYWRYRLVRAAMRLASWGYSRVRVEGLENLPEGPSVLCFNHQNWADPFFISGWLPRRPRLYFFGPEQEEMRRGLRNRAMRWAGVAVPYRPGRRGLVAATRRAETILRGGSSLAIAGEGRIHSGEAVILPLLEGPAYLALRAGVPLVPVAVNGTSWLAFRRTVRLRLGTPLAAPAGADLRPTSESVESLTAQAQASLAAMVLDFPDPPKPHWIGARLTELFNDWPEGSRPPVPPRPTAAA